MDLLTLLIGSLATWRVSHMIAKENGPLAIFARFRAYLAKNQKRIGGLFDMVSCIQCLSVYIGAVAAPWAAGGPLEWILYTFAFSALSVILERFTSL